MCENHGPSGMKARIVVQTVSNIKNPVAQNLKTVGFANPIVGNTLQLIVSFSIGDEVSIYNFQGQLVYKNNLQPMQNMMELMLANGTYVVRLTTKEGEMVETALVQ